METIIKKLYEQQSLTQEESQQLFDVIIRGELDPILMASALTALKIKGETPESLTLTQSALNYNSGRPNIKIGAFLSSLSCKKEFHKTLFYKTKHHTFTSEQLGTLTLRETDHGNRITIDQGRHRISFFTTATDEQRKWLFNYLNSYYSLKLEDV
ncbi:hypothetical protein [uncultured Kiloniella sp.]|mgnify:CR=1 FL=1|uniref:hypothetical protein n=1 Tax=uncultured Kiloniella sp. TaxID=1133091 RepID=UPI002613CFE8|nr:hypothetical protein [uncultured Kiloniella sp.]